MAGIYDAVQVIRCCKCRYWECVGDEEIGDYDIGTCTLTNTGTGDLDYCSYAELKIDP